jgi:hypothetical protein
MNKKSNYIFLRWIKRNSNLKTRSRILFFLVCTLLSVFLWFLNKLSDNYKTILHFPVQYINLPANKIYTNILPAHISVEVEAIGYTLMEYRFKNKNDTIILDYQKEHGMVLQNPDLHFISLKSRKEELLQQLKNVGRIVSISPDTIFFNFAEKQIIKIPVKLNAKLNFKKQYQIKDSIIINPAYIEIYGPSENSKEIDFIETEELVLNEIEENKQFQLAIKRPLNLPAYYRMSHKLVDITIPVERYTEISLKVNIKAANLPSNFEALLIPNKAELKLLVPFSKYNLIKTEEIILQADFSDYKNKSRIPLRLYAAPNFVRLVNIQPQEVEFILIKK